MRFQFSKYCEINGIVEKLNLYKGVDWVKRT